MGINETTPIRVKNFPLTYTAQELEIRHHFDDRIPENPSTPQEARKYNTAATHQQQYQNCNYDYSSATGATALIF
jgi:hypothetical protein